MSNKIQIDINAWFIVGLILSIAALVIIIIGLFLPFSVAGYPNQPGSRPALIVQNPILAISIIIFSSLFVIAFMLTRDLFPMVNIIYQIVFWGIIVIFIYLPNLFILDWGWGVGMHYMILGGITLSVSTLFWKRHKKSIVAKSDVIMDTSDIE